MENLSTVEEYKPTLKDRFRWNLIQPVKDWNRTRKLRKLDRLLNDLSGKDHSHIQREFRAIGYTDDEDGPNKWIQENVIQLMKVFSTQGHSGSSAPVAVAYFKRLANHKPLGPLTGEDWEWMKVEEGFYQNNRCGTVFKQVSDDGTEYAYDIDGKVFWEYYTDEDGVQQKSYYTCSESRVPVEFPYTVPDEPVYEYRESECE
jgi:hypothetical protein